MILSSMIKIIQRSVATKTLFPQPVLAQSSPVRSSITPTGSTIARFSTAPLSDEVNTFSDVVQHVSDPKEVTASHAGDGSKSTASSAEATLERESTVLASNVETPASSDADASIASITSEFRTGVVRWIDHQNQTGVITQDAQYSPGKPAARFRFRFFDIVPREERQFMSKIGKDLIEPRLNKDARVKFRVYERPSPKRKDNGSDQIESADKNEESKGRPYEKLKLGVCDIRYESGEHVPVMKFNDAMMLMRKEKAKLGHDVYNALASLDDPNEMASSINTSFNNCSNIVDWAKRQIYNPSEARKLITAEFGTKVFELMEEAEKGQIQDLKERVNHEYSLCDRKLDEFDRTFPDIWEEDSSKNLNRSGDDSMRDHVNEDEEKKSPSWFGR